jgi:hypothetical protein
MNPPKGGFGVFVDATSVAGIISSILIIADEHPIPWQEIRIASVASLLRNDINCSVMNPPKGGFGVFVAATSVAGKRRQINLHQRKHETWRKPGSESAKGRIWCVCHRDFSRRNPAFGEEGSKGVKCLAQG